MADHRVRRIGAGVELERIGVARTDDAVQRRPPDVAPLRVPEGAQDPLLRVAEDLEVEREPLVQGHDSPAPGIRSRRFQEERRREGVVEPAGRLDPEAVDPAVLESSAKAAVAGEGEADPGAVAREGRLRLAEPRPPVIAFARQRELAARGRGRRRLGHPETDEGIGSRRRRRRDGRRFPDQQSQEKSDSGARHRQD